MTTRPVIEWAVFERGGGRHGPYYPTPEAAEAYRDEILARRGWFARLTDWLTESVPFEVRRVESWVWTEQE